MLLFLLLRKIQPCPPRPVFHRDGDHEVPVEELLKGSSISG